MGRREDAIRSELAVLQCRRGDEEGFRALVRLWERPLLFYIRRFVPEPAAALDVLQEVWLRVFRHIGTLRDARALSPWLYRTARNAAITHLRRTPQWQPLEAESEEPAVDCEPDDNLFEGITAPMLYAALDRLPLAEREVLALRFLEEFSLDEVAGVVEAPVGTVKSRLHRAKRNLRALLEEVRCP